MQQLAGERERGGGSGGNKDVSGQEAREDGRGVSATISNQLANKKEEELSWRRHGERLM